LALTSCHLAVRDNLAIDMNEQIQLLMKQAGTDISGKWMSTDHAEKFAMLVIEAYNKELDESRRETKNKLGYSRIGLKNI
jgi:hypothetical protein